MTPTALDIAIGLIIGLSMLIGFFRGIIKEFFTLGGFIAAIFTSYKAGHILVPEFNQWFGVKEGVEVAKADMILGLISPAVAAKLASYGGTFLIVFIICILIGFFASRWMKEAGLGIIDKISGVGFGFLRGFLIVFLAYVPLTYLIEYNKMPEWAKQSQSVGYLQATLEWTNKHFGLDKMIEDRGEGLAIKFDKIKLDEVKENAAAAAGQMTDKVIDTVNEKVQEMKPAVDGAVPPAPAPVDVPVINAPPQPNIPTIELPPSPMPPVDVPAAPAPAPVTEGTAIEPQPIPAVTP